MANKKVFTSKEAMFRLIREWQETSISKKQFCKQSGIGYHTFNYWVKKYNASQDFQNIQPGFTEYKIIDRDGPLSVRLLFPNGVVAELPNGVDHKLVHFLINSFQVCSH